MDFQSDIERIALGDRIRDAINHDASMRRESRWKTRLSPSSLGEDCAAAGWYDWRWATPPKPQDGRMARYNALGEVHEKRAAEWLKNTGWIVREIDPATNEQIAIKDFAGHMYGKCDGIGAHPEMTDGIEILLEYKFVNNKRFATLTNKPLQISDPKYYGQICLYMRYLNLPACMFFPTSRTDDDIKPTIIPANNGYADDLMRKGETIMFSKTRPARIAESPAFHKCKNFCDHLEVCHGLKPVAINCRSCVHCIPVEGGTFACERFGPIPGKTAILAACPQHTPIR